MSDRSHSHLFSDAGTDSSRPADPTPSAEPEDPADLSAAGNSAAALTGGESTSPVRGFPGLSQLSINGVTTFRWSLWDDVAAVTELGLQQIGLWRRKIADFGEERSVELIRDSGLRVSSLSWAGGFTGSHRMTYEEALADGREAIQLAADLRAGCLVVVSGGRAGHTKNYAFKLFIEALAQLAEEAERTGVTLAVQPMHRIFSPDWSFLTSLDDAFRVIQQCDHPSLRLALDVHHIAEEPRLLERLRDLVPQVAVVQLNDGRFPPKSKYNHCQLGEGDVPLREIVQVLSASGYRGSYEIALWSRRIWRSDYRALLAECLQRFQLLCG